MPIDLTSGGYHTDIEIGDTVTFLPGYFYPHSGKVVVEEIYINPFHEELWMARFMYHGEMRSAPLEGCVLVKSGKDINPYLWR